MSNLIDKVSQITGFSIDNIETYFPLVIIILGILIIFSTLVYKIFKLKKEKKELENNLIDSNSYNLELEKETILLKDRNKQLISNLEKKLNLLDLKNKGLILFSKYKWDFPL